MPTPKTCAIVGDVLNPTKWANKSLRAHQMAGYRCYAIATAAAVAKAIGTNTVGGESVYTSLADVPGHLNRVTMYLRPSLVLNMLEQIALRGCDELFLNPGTYNDEVIKRAESLGLNPVVGCSIIDVGVNPGGL